MGAMTDYLHARTATATKTKSNHDTLELDMWLVGALMTLLSVGLVIMGSASITIADRHFGQPFYYVEHQLVYIAVGLLLTYGILHTRVSVWEKLGPFLLFLGTLFLMLVLIPGIGREVNGSIRWLPLGLINLQPSEMIKLFVVVFLAGYLVRREEEVSTTIKDF